MHLTPTFATFFAVLSFSFTSIAINQPSPNVIRVPLERKSFFIHQAGPSSNHDPRDLAARIGNAAGRVNSDFLKVHVVSVAM